MNDGRDAEDARLLDSGEHARLLAAYEPVIIGRCVAALRGSLEAEDVAQDVKLRLCASSSAPRKPTVGLVEEGQLTEYAVGSELVVDGEVLRSPHSRRIRRLFPAAAENMTPTRTDDR